MEAWRFISIILNLGISWKSVVIFTLQPLYPRGKSSLYPLDRRLGVSQSRSPRCQLEKIFSQPEIERRQSILQPIVVATGLSLLLANTFYL
jgi:hypothetical protein